MAYGTLNAGAITPGSGATLTVSEAVTFTGAVSHSDANITNVGDISLDTISSDAGTSIGVTLGTDAGDDFNVGSGKLVVEGDTGRVGIGTAAPASILDLEIASTASHVTALTMNNPNGTTSAGISIDFETGGIEVARITGYHQTSDKGGLKFLTTTSASTPAVKMTIDMDGYVGIGRAPVSNKRLIVKGVSGDTTHQILNLESGDAATERFYITNNGYTALTTVGMALAINRTDALDSSLRDMVAFYKGGTLVGQIKCSNAATSYESGSDYRLKENIVAMTGSIDRLKLLKPSRFNFIINPDDIVDGFIAHEAQEVIPEAVSSTKDAMTAAVLYVEGDQLPEGKNIGDVKTASVPDMQGIDQAKIVPLLVGALQEAIARIETLESP